MHSSLPVPPSQSTTQREPALPPPHFPVGGHLDRSEVLSTKRIGPPLPEDPARQKQKRRLQPKQVSHDPPSAPSAPSAPAPAPPPAAPATAKADQPSSTPKQRFNSWLNSVRLLDPPSNFVGGAADAWRKAAKDELVWLQSGSAGNEPVLRWAWKEVQGPSPDENKIRNIVAHAMNEQRQKARQGGVHLPLISIPVLSIVLASNAPAPPPTPIVIDLTEDSPEPELTAPVVTAEPSQSTAGPARPQAHSALPSIVLPPSVKVRVANPLQDSASSASSRLDSPSSNAPPVVYGSSQAPNAEPIAATAPPLLAPTAITTRKTPSPAPPKPLLSPIRPPSAPVATAEVAPPTTTGRRERAVSVNAAKLALATARLHAASQAGLAHAAPAPALTVGQVVQAIPRRASQGSNSRPQDLHHPHNSSNGGLPGPPPPRAADANYTSTLPAPIPLRPHSAPSQQPHSQPPARVATPPIAEAQQYLIGHSVVPSAMSESFFDWLPKHGLERSQGFIRSWGYELGISTREMETILHFLMGYAAMDRPTGEEVARRRRVAAAHLHEVGRLRTVDAQWRAQQQQQQQQHHNHPVQQVYPLPTAGQDRPDATFVLPPPHRRASDGHQHTGVRFIESNPQPHDPSRSTRPKTSDGQQEQQQFQGGPCASPVSADFSPPQPQAAQLPPPQQDAGPPPPTPPPALVTALSNYERALLCRAFEIGAEQSGELKGGVEVLEKRWEERMQTIRELGEMEKPRAAREEALTEETNGGAAT